MSDIQIINPITYPGWDEMLLPSPGHSFFHTSAWARVLADSYGYKPLYFTVIEEGKLQALVPMMEVNSFLTGKRGISLPFTDYCDPISLDGTPFTKLLNRIVEYGQKHRWRYLEIRGGQHFLREDPSSSSYLLHTVGLTRNGEKIFSGLRDSTRRNIKKAAKQGVKVEISQSLDSLKAFCRLNCITRKRHGLPAQPFCFFKKVHEHVISQNLGIVVLGSSENNIVAAAVFFHFGKDGFFKYGASDKTYHHLRPNNLVMWEAIKWYLQSGHETFSFGRTELLNIGLRQYKTGWGAEERLITYHTYDLGRGTFVPNRQKISEFQQKMLRRIPIPILNVIGSTLYKHMG